MKLVFKFEKVFVPILNFYSYSFFTKIELKLSTHKKFISEKKSCKKIEIFRPGWTQPKEKVSKLKVLLHAVPA